jgi:hypothetical protein
MRLLYKPVGIVLGLIAGILGRQLFDLAWERVDDEEPPEATTRDTTVGRLVGAAAMQGAIFSVVRALVNRAGAAGWFHLTGVWPGEKKPDPA